MSEPNNSYKELKLADSFINKASVNSKRTGSTYKAGLNKYIEFCRSTKQEPIDTDTILDFHGYLEDTVSPSATRAYMAAIRMYIKHLKMNRIDLDLNMELIAEYIKNGRKVYIEENVSEKHHVLMAEMPNLINHFSEYPIPTGKDKYDRRLSVLRDRALFWTLYETGCRIGESRRLDRIHFARALRGEVVSVIGKGKRKHKLFFPQDGMALKYIKLYLDERRDSSDPLFIAHSRNASGARLSITSVYNVIKKQMDLIQMDERITPHDIRHYRASTLVDDGAPLHVVQTLLNHRDIGTTRKFYAPVTKDSLVRSYL